MKKKPVKRFPRVGHSERDESNPYLIEFGGKWETDARWLNRQQMELLLERIDAVLAKHFK